MSFSNELNELSKMLQDIAYVASEKAQVVAGYMSEKAQNTAENAKIRLAIANDQRSLEKNYRALGEWYANQLGEEIPADAVNIVTAIREALRRIEENQAKLEVKKDAKEDAEEESCNCAEEESAQQEPAEEVASESSGEPSEDSGAEG